MGDDADAFFTSIRPLLVLGQISGVLPLTGTTSSDSSCLNFSWKNWQIFYVGVVLISTAVVDVCSTIDNLTDGIRLDNFGSTVFYTVCVLNILFFVDIAKDLPELCRYVGCIEARLKDYGFPKNLNNRIKIFIYVFFTLSIFEHGLLTCLNIKGAIERSSELNKSFLESFYVVRFPVMLEYTGHNDFFVIFIFVLNVICTFNWNYLDYFLVCMSMEISGKYEQISKAIDSKKSQQSSKFWEKVSEDYNNLSIMSKKIASKISKLVFMSYCSNLYHISLQLLRTLKFQGDAYAKVYFYFSMIYLILRTLAVSLQAAKIIEQSQAPKHILYALKNPPDTARRLLFQVLTDEINITGLRFFTVNRKFIITLTGTLITYEIILIQLNSLRYENSRL